MAVILLPDTMIGLNNYYLPNPFFCAPTIKEQELIKHFSAITTKRSLKQSSSSEFHSKLRLLANNNTFVCKLVKPSLFWWDNRVPVGPEVENSFIAPRLRSYLGLNQTHSFGHQCSADTSQACIGVHVRSGDVFRGAYNESDGHWNAAPHIHQQPPLEYYLSAIRNFRFRKQRQLTSAIIACEDFNNPVCEVFQVLAKTDPSIEIFTTDLLTTLQRITCCEEIVLSLSTFSKVLTLSPRLKHLHHYGSSKNCNDTRNAYDDTSYTAKGYNFSSWHNSEVERHHMLQPYDMEEHTCYSQK